MPKRLAWRAGALAFGLALIGCAEQPGGGPEPAAADHAPIPKDRLAQVVLEVPGMS